MSQEKLSARVFNVMQLDERRGILEKTSRNKSKLINEIRWYLKLPEPLHYLVPHIYDYSLEQSAPFIRMEYYGYRTLHDLMIYDELPEEHWREIFNRLRFYVEDMRRYRLDVRRNEVLSSIRSMYIDKTLHRLDSIRAEFEQFFEHPITINGRPHRSLNEIIELLPPTIERMLEPDAEHEFSIIHGDLCFTNILIEEKYNFMRLIDPRGSFGAFDIYGDSRYDPAKIFHSMEGHYDYIIADKFTVNAADNRIDYAIDGDCENILQVFNDVFDDLLEGKRPAIRLIESTLFLSMLPLHSDSFERQLTMLATGVELFDGIIDGGD